MLRRLLLKHHSGRLRPVRLDRDSQNRRAVLLRRLGRPQHRASGFDHREVILAPPVLHGRGRDAYEVPLQDALDVLDVDEFPVRANGQNRGFV
eukprot:30497-Pelagococcus_subviridis.AAC.45